MMGKGEVGMVGDGVVVNDEVRGEVAAAEELQVRYSSLRITTHNDYVAASDVLKEIKTRGRRLEELRRSMTKPLDEAKARIMELFSAPSAALSAAEKSVKAAMLKFQQDRERERLEEEKRLREEKRREMDKLAEEALAAAEDGDVDGALGIINQQVSVEKAPIIITNAPVAKVYGVTKRKVWKWRVVDITLVPREYMQVDDRLVGDLVRSGQGQVEIPGIEVYFEEIITSRGV